MSAPLKCDVLIAGGGPAGLSVAESLPKHLSKVVLHQDREIGMPVRTSGGTWVRDMERLGVPPHLYHQINEIEFRSDNAQSLHRLRDWKMAVLDITGLYRWIAGHALENGAEILTGTKFLSAEERDGGYLCSARARDGSTRAFQAKYLIDATGTQSAVLSSLGLGQKPERIGVGIEYDYAMPGGVSDRAVLIVGSQALTGYGWIFPAPNNTLRIGVGVIQPDTDISPRDLIGKLITPEVLESYGLELGERIKVNAGVIPSVAYEKQLVYGNVVRTGDAANFATPTVGEGIRQAMEFGLILGEALGRTIETGKRGPLKAYERKARGRFARDYHFGFMTNRRMADYTIEDWDKSVRRVSRLSESEMAELVRSEFSPPKLLRTAAKQVWHKIRR
jgi:digeranylgeranylglycerophospholipid reductase